MVESIILAAIGWVASPVVAKLLNKGFASSGLNAEKKLQKLTATVLQVLKSVNEKAKGSEHCSEMEDWLQDWLRRLKDAYGGVQDALDLLNNRRRTRKRASLHVPNHLKWPLPVLKGVGNMLSPYRIKLKRSLNKLEKIVGEGETLCKLLDANPDQAVAPFRQRQCIPLLKTEPALFRCSRKCCCSPGSEANGDAHRLEGEIARLTAAAELKEGEIAALERRVGALKEAEEEIREKDDEIIKLTDALVVLEDEKKKAAAVLGAIALGAVLAGAAAVTAVYLRRTR